ncbi:MAG TPA: carboxypeptidase regulatory-like domain-containing protein [Phycisphaerae bacterium]|nr:carboxypeptidase regulatory-like domain-containing protein [Phycisphaerae bacterium]
MAVDYIGAGVRQARVRIESPDAGRDDPPLVEGVTNNLGEIEVQLPRPVDGPVRVRIIKEGYAELVQEVDPTDETNPAFVDAMLEGTDTLSGKVLDHATNKPIAGARIECGNGGRTLDSTSDAEGKFTFGNLVRGPAQLAIKADGYGTQREKIILGEYRIHINRTLRPERPVEVIVEDNEGRPAPEVTVEAMVEPTFDLVVGKTDESGRAVLLGVNADAIALHLRMNGERYVRMPEFSRRIELPPAASQAASAPAAVSRRFTVRPAGGVKGRVIDAGTRESIVGVRAIAGREVRGNMPMTWTDDEGGYELGGLEPGFNVISFQHGDYCTEIRESRLAAGSLASLDVELGAGLPIEGVVLDEKGEPLGEVRVSADSWNGYATLGMRYITGEDGKFLIPHAPAGEVTFSFIRPGYGVLMDQVLTSGKRDCRITLAEMKQPAGGPSGPDGGRREKLKVGDEVPDLTLTTTDGARYKLSELRGKYVFLDCWASWCGPCVAEIPHVKALWEIVKGRPDFVMIGVSLDTNRQAFNAAVSDHSLRWPQTFGPKSGAQEAFEVLDGYGIPYTCLIGPDGKLMAQHLRGPDLARQVMKFLPDNREYLPPSHQERLPLQMPAAGVKFPLKQQPTSGPGTELPGRQTNEPEQ